MLQSLLEKFNAVDHHDDPLITSKKMSLNNEISFLLSKLRMVEMIEVRSFEQPVKLDETLQSI